MTDRATCRHCNVGRVCRPKGLCRPCYQAFGRLYPSARPGAGAGRATCPACGHLTGSSPAYLAAGGGVCGTCKLPPGLREVVHARLALYERRAAAVPPLPLFTGEGGP